jgi:rhomboid family GlyGly-CTERM serine protease
MDLLALTADALREPWRLWTSHLVHFGWNHVLANTLALAVPAILVRRQDRGELLITAFLVMPLLSLLLLPGLGPSHYRGASGLACALWAWVGLRLAIRRESFSAGLALLGGLALKVTLEGAFGSSLMPSQQGWQSLPAAHVWGALLGLAASFQRLPGPEAVVPHRA